MTARPANEKAALLSRELMWLVRLRWLAGAAVILAALLDPWLLDWQGRAHLALAVGVVILIGDTALWIALRRARAPLMSVRSLHRVAWAQILFDLVCLTLLAAWTGGAASPVVVFFVFHMVFASLLLSRRGAYLTAVAAAAMLAAALWLTRQWPRARPEIVFFSAWAASLVVTVHLANRITRGLFRRERARVRYYRRARRIEAHLAAQERAMAHHEKMVALGHLAAGVAHEINNPLASMDAVLQLMKRNPASPRPEMVDALREQVQRVQRLVRQLTAFAHPEKGQPEVADIDEVVRTALRLVRLDHRLRQVSVEHLPSARPVEANVIPRALQQVLINLVLNALDAVAGGDDPRVVVRTRQEGPRAVIEITDNGHGIPPEHLHRVFEPFFTTKPVGKGTGLGLSISQSLVREQGGDLSVASTPGRTTFTIRLPTSPPHAAVATLPSAAALSLGAAAPPPGAAARSIRGGFPKFPRDRRR